MWIFKIRIPWARARKRPRLRAREGLYSGLNDVDDDCDMLVDGQDASLIGATTWYADGDGDGYGDVWSGRQACGQPPGGVADDTDCDDGEPTINPAAPEIPGDGVDQNCDGYDGTAPSTGVDYSTVWGSEMVVVEAGTFTMGSGRGDPNGWYRDHEVTLTRDYWLGRTEVTQGEWAAWAGAPDPEPSDFARCSGCPVETVSWLDAARYMNSLSVADGLPPCYLLDGSDMVATYLADPYSCPGYRLPVEAEWEYAARAGEDTEFSGSDSVQDVAWMAYNSGSTTHEVCMLAVNAWGLCDMSGNVWEWTNDWFSPTYGGYDSGIASTDPPGPSDGSIRLDRGGSWKDGFVCETVSDRFWDWPEFAGSYIGFRLARTVPY